MQFAYRVDCAEAAEAQLLDIYLQAKVSGFDKEVSAAARVIEQRARHEPLLFGEPHFFLPDAGLVHVAFAAPLGVKYGVIEKEHRVLILSYYLLPGNLPNP